MWYFHAHTDGIANVSSNGLPSSSGVRQCVVPSRFALVEKIKFGAISFLTLSRRNSAYPFVGRLSKRLFTVRSGLPSPSQSLGWLTNGNSSHAVFVPES